MIKSFKVFVLVIILLMSYNSFGQRITSEKKKVRVTTAKMEINVISPKTSSFRPTKENNHYPVLNAESIEVIVDVDGGVGWKRVKINDGKATQYADGNYYKQVKLSTGENIIKIEAEDSRSNKASDSIKVICTYQYDI
ncbi:MAG: hypothetical protein HC831_16805, partial [Chloroflexia bacterium]|nr:hypothetical protein [Chloroflexia bacterium]